MAKKAKAQIWLEYALAAGSLRLLEFLPLRAAVAIGMGSATLGYHLLRRHRRIGMRNLEIAFPEKSEDEREAILKAAFQNMGRVGAYVSRFNRLTYETMSSVVDYDPDPEFAARYNATVAAGRGRIVLTGHTGNWELHAFAYPVLFDCGPISFLARRMDNPLIDAMVTDIRTRL